MDENLKRQIEGLTPSIEDAPARVRRRKKKSPIGISMILAIGLIGGIIYMGDRNGWADHLKQEVAPVRVVKSEKVGEATKDTYLEQVNTMLHPVAEIEWVDDTAENGTERQTVFTDENYRPTGTVNTIRMPRPEAAQQSTHQRQQPYVTVVKETKASCWPLKEGSIECRQHKARMQQHWRRACDINQNSHACTQANRYDLR